MFGFIWNTLIKQPILQTLLWFAGLTGNLGIAIILLTLVIQLILTPLRVPSLRSAQKMRKIRPEINKLKEKHGDDKMAFAQAQMELYREHGLSPLGGIVPTLLSLPIIFALYQVLLNSIGTIENVSQHFLWISDVTKPDPLYILPLLVAGGQFLLVKTGQFGGSPEPATNDKKEGKSGSTEDIMQSVQSQMTYIFPAVSGFITATLPAGVGLYWFVSVVFAIMQQKVLERLDSDGS